MGVGMGGNRISTSFFFAGTYQLLPLLYFLPIYLDTE